MANVRQPVTDDSIKVRQLTHYQFSWVAGDPGKPGTYTLQLVLDEGAWEEVLTLDPDDADNLQDLLEDTDTVHYDVERRVLMFGSPRSATDPPIPAAPARWAGAVPVPGPPHGRRVGPTPKRRLGAFACPRSVMTSATSWRTSTTGTSLLAVAASAGGSCVPHDRDSKAKRCRRAVAAANRPFPAAMLPGVSDRNHNRCIACPAV